MRVLFIYKKDDQQKWYKKIDLYKTIDLVIFRSFKLNVFIDFSKSLVLLKNEIIIFLTFFDQFCEQSITLNLKKLFILTGDLIF
jgi:hypothetical protein